VSQASRYVLRPLALVGVMGIIALGAAACSDDSGSSSKSGSKPASGTPLVGTNWVLSSGDALGVPITGVSVSIRFGSDGRVSGESGCNSYNGAYKTSGTDTLTIGPNIATTLVLCEGAVDAVERAYIALLPKVQTYSIGGTTLSLSGADNKVLLEYTASSGAAALAGHWEATSYYTGNAIQSVIIGTTLTADFTATAVSGDAGCNVFNGPFTVKGEAIIIGPLASTRRACADPAVGTQEQQYLAALQLAKTYRVTGDKLELFRDGGTIAAIFARGK